MEKVLQSAEIHKHPKILFWEKKTSCFSTKPVQVLWLSGGKASAEL